MLIFDVMGVLVDQLGDVTEDVELKWGYLASCI